jgi:uncharacterized protein
MNTTTAQGVGLGLKPQHFDEALACTAPGLWWEVHAENYMVDGGPRLAWLLAMRERFALSIHGVGLSLTGPAPLDLEHLARFKRLVDTVQPALVSEHLAWCFDGETYFPDLFESARTSALINHVAPRIAHVQDVLGRTLAIENPTLYRQDLQHELSEVAFWTALCERTGCQILLDVNNAVISAHNAGQADQVAIDWMCALPSHLIAEIHLAGHDPDPHWGASMWIDSHAAPVCERVWAAYALVMRRHGPVPTLIERDHAVPSLTVLLAEREHALRFCHANACEVQHAL